MPSSSDEPVQTSVEASETSTDSESTPDNESDAVNMEENSMEAESEGGEPKEEQTKPINPRIQTLAQQIHLMKKGEWIIDGQASYSTKLKDNMDSQETNDSSNQIDNMLSKEKKEITLKNGTKVLQQRVGSSAFKRKDDEFTLKRKTKRALPFDFRIGQLADLKTEVVRDKLIIDKLTNFFTLFATQKKVEQSALLSGSKDLVTNNLNYVIESGAMPDTIFRLGKVSFSNNNMARVNIRFYYKNSCADGEVILESAIKGKETDWLISDIQVDFMKLLSTYEGFSEPYLPSSYQHFDWE